MGNGHVTDVTVSVRGELVVGMEGEVGRTESAVLSMHVHHRHSVSDALPRGAVGRKRVPTPLQDGFNGRRVSKH